MPQCDRPADVISNAVRVMRIATLVAFRGLRHSYQGKKRSRWPPRYHCTHKTTAPAATARAKLMTRASDGMTLFYASVIAQIPRGGVSGEESL